MSVASEEALSRELPVVEIFDSIQGEGYYIGQLSTFVRLAGCNMQPACVWCDTTYAQGYESATRMSIADIIKRCTQAHVVITGGEPLVHARVVELCDQLYRRGKLVTVETNGTIHRPALRWICNLISISPKLESAGHQPNLDVVGAYVRTANHFGNVQIKFVIGSDKDWEMALKAIEALLPLAGSNPIYWAFQPKADPDDCIDDLLMKAESLSTTIVTSNLGERLQHVRVLPQLHRLLWGNQRGV
jgi:7-carboxy-7-deazaguanine synthase